MSAPVPLRITRETRAFVLTGAGISAESGIATFRDANGLWQQHRVEDVASPEGWRADPELVWRFYSQRRAQAEGCEPNPAHVALARLEEYLGDNLFLCTQNVDPLHERAGSRRVVHMHGELFRSRCDRSGEDCARPPFVDDRSYLVGPGAVGEGLPRCACGGTIRPHIVWFGEMPFHMHEIKRAVQRCDLFLTVGSSGAVYPAAGLVGEIAYRKQCGEHPRAVYVGLERPDNADRFDECRLGRAGELLPSLFEFA